MSEDLSDTQIGNPFKNGRPISIVGAYPGFWVGSARLRLISTLSPYMLYVTIRVLLNMGQQANTSAVSILRLARQ